MVAQLILNGLVTGLLIAMPALALTLVFGVLKFPNFAIGAMLTLGAYAAWVANQVFHLPMAAAAVFSAAVTALVAVVTDRLVYAKLRDSGSITLLVASVGVSLVIENICRFIFGNTTRSFDVTVDRPLRWQGLRIRHEQIVIAATVIVCLVIFQLVLRASPLGRAMRAVADNAALAAVRGIERDSVAMVTWALAGVLTALSGILAGLDRAVEPLLGWSYQIPVFAAAILGGLGQPAGAVVGALLIGVAEELSALVIPTNYRQAVSFSVILLLLLVRSPRAVRRQGAAQMIGYGVTLIDLVAIASLVGLGLNLQWGTVGLVNFGVVGFVALGAYAAALLPPFIGWFAAMLGAGLISALASVFLALLSVRLEDDYLAIVTLGFGEIVRLVLLNEDHLTGGALGIAGIKRPFAAVIPDGYDDVFFMLFAIVLVAITFVLLQGVLASPFGRALRAIRDDAIVAASLAKPVLMLRVKAFALGGAVIGIAGALHAFYMTYIDPGQFTPIITAYAFMAVIAGGRGSNKGLLLGAGTILILLEATRFLKDLVSSLDGAQLAALRLGGVGIGIVLLLILRPEGLLPERRQRAADFFPREPGDS